MIHAAAAEEIAIQMPVQILDFEARPSCSRQWRGSAQRKATKGCAITSIAASRESASWPHSKSGQTHVINRTVRLRIENAFLISGARAQNPLRYRLGDDDDGE